MASRLGAHALRRTLARRAAIGVLGASGVVYFMPTVCADVLEKGDIPKRIGKAPSVLPSAGEHELDLFAWGSNKYHTLSGDDAADTKRPVPFVELSGEGVALRDLAFHEKHAACVDAAGNLYQWGDDFFGDLHTTSRKPVPTLQGKDLVKIAISENKIYALSRTGRLYIVSSSQALQKINNLTPGANRSSWDSSWLWSSSPTVDFAELIPDSKLHHGENFTSISAGRSHVIALTSSGRTFSAPISSSANSHGQLGIRKISLPSLTSPNTREQVELLPRGLSDPYAKATPAIRFGRVEEKQAKDNRDETDIRYCDMLFEIPSLKGVEVAQALAGDRASYVRTAKSGRVLSWGANEYGQLGLGATFTTEYVPVPTEVLFSRNYPKATGVRCIDLEAGGDVVYFTIESQRDDPTQPAAGSINIDLLAAGMGQWGSLGNNQFNQAQGSPLRVKSVSGVKEYNESTGTVQPLAPKSVSASPTHHAVVVLDTFHLDGNTGQSRDESRKGRDVMIWGSNSDYQLGLGRRSNIPQPTPLPTEAFAGGFDVDDKVARMMTRERKVEAIRDLQGNKIASRAKVEQTVVAGWGCTAMYWKVV